MKIRTMMIVAAAMGGLSAAPAFAQDATYQVTGTVNAACYANTGGTIAFGTIAIDSTTGKLTPSQSKSSSAQNVWCNGVSASVSYTGNSITTTNTSADTDFTSTLGFTPAVSIDGAPFASGDAIHAINGPMVVSANNLTDGGKLPVAGAYTGSIVVTLTPGA